MGDNGEDYGGPIEILSLTISECYVYKVPPLRTASGHRAEDWNLAAPLFTGCLKVYQADTKLRISVYTYKDPKKTVTSEDNLNVFGECPVEVKPGDNIITFVDSVIDSSRYYVIRIKDPKSTRTTLLGIGFRERDQAFDFKNILNDYVRYVNRMDLASQMAALAVDETASDKTDSGLSTSPSTPLHLAQHIAPLKEGEKIKVALKPKGPPHSSSLHTHSSSSSHCDATHDETAPKSKGFLLKPPPAPGSTVFVTVPTAGAATASSSTDRDSFDQQQKDSVQQDVNTTVGEEDWGDFN